MTRFQFGLITALLILSVLFLVDPLLVIIIRRMVLKPSCEQRNKLGVSRMLIFSAFLISSIWCLRYAVGYYGILFPELSVFSSNTSLEGLTWLEEIFNSMVHAIQTFSMDEDYTAYIISGKTMLREMFGVNSRWQGVYGVYAAVLNFVAPIAGGAVIFEILASIFPKIRLFSSYLAFWKEKYYFSELNEASLALVKSILSNKYGLFKKPIIVFTDAYLDDEDEKSSEKMIRAKSMGAICIRDDLAHVAKPSYGKRYYYLMDESEFENLQTLLNLVENNNLKSVCNSRIYLFVQSDAYVQIEKRIIEKFNSEEAQKIFKKNEKPIIVPINGYRNLVHNLFRDVPLYEPLINKPNTLELNIAIFGNGIIGTEAFLSAYWFGQMMISHEDDGQAPISECNMTINVVSKDKEDEFWSKINYINPEIKETVEVIGKSTTPPNENILSYDGKGSKNKPYCKVRYVQSDVKIGGFWNDSSEEIKSLLESDYFIVALGNDADNISIADRLRCSIGKTHLETTGNSVVIAYAVFDSKLSKLLNKKSHYKYCCNNKKSDIFMYSFGALEQVYSCENIYMSKSMLLAEKIENDYFNLQEHIKDNKRRVLKEEDSNFSYWASLARAMHIKYKIFSLGLLEKSIFDFWQDEENGIKKNEEHVQEKFDLYKQIATLKEPDKASTDVQEKYYDIEGKKHYLAWLEHRRWNAFTRTLGYRHTSDYKKNFELNGVNHKNMELKLHPCLIEAEFPLLNDDKTYQNSELKKIFNDCEGESIREDKENGLSAEKVWQRMSASEQVKYLVYKKECCNNRVEHLKNIDKSRFDLLDMFSCAWCELATPKIIEDIDSAINSIKDNKKVELKDIFKVGYCYYKQYDYYNCDF